MTSGSQLYDVARSLIVCATIITLGYLGFSLVQDRLRNPVPKVVRMDKAELDSLITQVSRVESEVKRLERQVSKTLDDLGVQLTAIEEQISESAPALKVSNSETWERSLKVYRLVAKYNQAGDTVEVSGKLRCHSGTWTAVEMAFVFRGRNNVINHRDHFSLPGVSEKTPLDHGMTREFAFDIAKFSNFWEQYNVTVEILRAVPLKP